MKTIIKLQVFLLSAILLSGCLAPPLPPKAKPAEDYFTPHEMASADFAPAIAKLTGIAADQKNSPIERAEAHRRLAILYLIPGNPDRNFNRAVDELGRFLEIAPERLDGPAAASWTTALQSHEELQARQEEILNLRSQVAKLATHNQQLAKEKKELQTTNLELEKTIEELKKLDLSLGKKRRAFR